MSYFKKFPQILYSFDSGNSVGAFTVTDVMRRVKANDANIRNVLSYDEYDVRDGETPEILADKVYNDSGLHWVILIANEILDPRWDWPVDTLSLQNYIEGKYGLANINAVHHYENTSGDTVYFKTYAGNVDIAITGASSSIAVVGNNTAFLTEFVNTGVTVRFNASTTAYTVVAINSNTSLTLSGSAITSAVNAGSMIDNNSYLGSKTAVTNTDYELSINESKRRIKILKAQFVPQFVQNFTGLLTNGRE
jgi:hypothetical protein